MAKLPRYFHFEVKVVNHGTAIELQDMSGADYEEVVRCRDCKHNYGTESNPECDYMQVRLKPNDYCSRGRQKK